MTLNKPADFADFSKKKEDIPKKIASEIAKPKIGIFEHIKNMFSLEKEAPKSNMKLDIVYIIWSVDDWKTFQSQVGRQKACRSRAEDNVIRTHEFFLQNVDKIFKKGQLLQLVVCHQIDENIYYDSNNENCYSFELVSNN